MWPLEDSGERSVTVTGSSQIFTSKRPFPFLAAILCWITFCSLLGATLIWAIEGGKHSYFTCFFLALASTTCTSLATINLATLATPSLAVMMICMMAGSLQVTSLFPVIVRMHYLKQHIPPDIHTFDLKNFQVRFCWGSSKVRRVSCVC